MSAIIGTHQYIEYFNNPQGIVQGGIGAALAGGSIIGALMAGPISNKIGRRDSIFFACLWWLFGTALQTSCNGIPMLIVGRLLNGVCVGIAPEVFKMSDDDALVVLQQHPPEALCERVEQAVRSCPTNALSVGED